MDYKKLVEKLINGNTILTINKIKNLIIIYQDNKYKFDDFLKEYQLDNDPIELFEILVELGYEFNSSHFAYYVNNAYIDNNDLIDWYRRIQGITVS